MLVFPKCCTSLPSHNIVIQFPYMLLTDRLWTRAVASRCSGMHCAGGGPRKVPHASLHAHCLMTRNLLFDLELLAHADYFVGTTKSGLSPIVEVLLAYHFRTHLVSSCRVWIPVP